MSKNRMCIRRAMEARETIMDGHPVHIVTRYPTDHNVYFKCIKCKTDYVVAERFTKTINYIWSRDTLMHECPKCGTMNRGSWTMPGTFTAGYANDW